MDYRPVMNYLAQLRREQDAFAACLDGDLSTPIEHCGDWTLYDLADHVGRSNLWAAAAVREKHRDHRSAPAPRDRAELVPWLETSSAVLLAALDADPADDAWTFFPPHTVGFWQRRRCVEALVHRWDAEHAIGAHTLIDPVFADDAVAEVIDTMAPLLVQEGRASVPAHAVRLIAADTGSSRVFGTGPVVADITGTAADLALMLWGRLALDDAAIGWDGDRAAARTVLAGPLVP
jgi:uncharacterized protein (TIGR03083 family)